MTVSVPPLGRREVRFGPVVLEGSQVTLSIVEADCLPDDNQLVARHKPGVRLSVAPRGSLKGLDLLTRLLPEVDPTAPIERTVHVLLGHTPRQLPLPCVTAPPRGSGSGNPGRFGRLSDDPLLRGLDLSDVTVARAIALPLETDGLTPIAWSAEEETPLIARSRKRIALAFWPGPPVTNWPGDASFPVFWRRVIRALFPDAGQFETTIAGPAVTDNRGWLSEDLARLAPVSGRQLARVDLGPLAGMLAAFLLLVYAVVRCKTGRQSSY